MVTIEINEETEGKDAMASALFRIANLINEGYTSGIDPAWSLRGEYIAGDEVDDGVNEKGEMLGYPKED